MTTGHGSEGGFRAYIATYADTIAANFRQRVDAQPEDQLKAPVGELLKGLAHIMHETWTTAPRFASTTLTAGPTLA